MMVMIGKKRWSEIVSDDWSCSSSCMVGDGGNDGDDRKKEMVGDAVRRLEVVGNSCW